MNHRVSRVPSVGGAGAPCDSGVTVVAGAPPESAGVDALFDGSVDGAVPVVSAVSAEPVLEVESGDELDVDASLLGFVDVSGEVESEDESEGVVDVGSDGVVVDDVSLSVWATRAALIGSALATRSEMTTPTRPGTTNMKMAAMICFVI